MDSLGYDKLTNLNRMNLDPFRNCQVQPRHRQVEGREQGPGDYGDQPGRTWLWWEDTDDIIERLDCSNGLHPRRLT